MNPLLEVMKIEGVGVLNFPCSQPFAVTLKVIPNFLSIEYAVNHMATK